MRNRIVQNDKQEQEPVSTRLLFFHAKSFCQCQEKPGNETLAALRHQAAVVVQVLLQVGERALYLVVCVRHPPTIFPLEGEKIREIEIQAVHRRSQASVRIVHLSVLVETFVTDRVLPFLFPLLVILLEIILFNLMKSA